MASDEIMGWGVQPAPLPSPPLAPHFVTSPQSPICHHYKMAPMPLFTISTETASYAVYKENRKLLNASQGSHNNILIAPKITAICEGRKKTTLVRKIGYFRQKLFKRRIASQKDVQKC